MIVIIFDRHNKWPTLANLDRTADFSLIAARHRRFAHTLGPCTLVIGFDHTHRPYALVIHLRLYSLIIHLRPYSLIKRFGAGSSDLLMAADGLLRPSSARRSYIVKEQPTL